MVFLAPTPWKTAPTPYAAAALRANAMDTSVALTVLEFAANTAKAAMGSIMRIVTVAFNVAYILAVFTVTNDKRVVRAMDS